MEIFLSHYLGFWLPVGYLVVFLAMMVEGDAALFAAAFLTHQGFFNLGVIIVVVFLGVLIGDLGWYWLG